MASLLQLLSNRVNAGSMSLPRSSPSEPYPIPDSSADDSETRAVVKAFKLQSVAELKVVLSAMILSECVYKLVDVGPEESAKAASMFVSQLPPGLVSLQHMQSVSATVPHRYMLGDDGQSLYVVFMGTKHARDLLADANVLQEAVWKSKVSDKQQVNALAHRGFLARARGIPIEALYAHATRQGRRLVLCGHSLGGAVALLCTLRLLQGLPKGDPSLYCICFGTPAIGNAALAALVAEYGWNRHILNFILPEDIIPRLLALPAVPGKAQLASLTSSGQPQAEQEQQQQDSIIDVESQPNGLPSASAQVPPTVHNRLQNLRAILTAMKPRMQQLGTATGQQTQADAKGQQPSQDSSLDEALQAADTVLNGNPPISPGQEQPSQLGTIQDTKSELQLNRLQALRAAIAARWPPNQQQQSGSEQGQSAVIGSHLPDESEQTVQAVQKQVAASHDSLQASASAPGHSKFLGSLWERLQRRSAKLPAEQEAEPGLPATLNQAVSHQSSSDLQQQPDQLSESSPDRAKQVAEEQSASGRPLLQRIRSFTGRPPLPGTQPDPAPCPPPAHASSDVSLDSAQQQQEQQDPEAKQPSRLWGLNTRVQGAWQGASSRVSAMRALLPAYPAYVHIGSHQILLPASPAMTEALKTAQQKGVAEERQLALLMHRMSAYRNRAVAICRSVFHWQPAKSTAQISLSTTLAPPITFIQATVIIPPLPLPAAHNSLAETPAPTLGKALAPGQPSQSDQPHLGTSSTDQQQGSTPQQQLAQGGEAQKAASEQSQRQTAASVNSHRQPQQQGQQSPDGSAQPSLQHQDPSSAGVGVLGPSQQAATQRSPSTRQKHKSQKLQSKEQKDSPTGASQSVEDSSDAKLPLDTKAGRWLPPISVRWQGKQKQPPRLSIRISVQGSVHSMPAKAQLHVLGQWCRAQFIERTPLQSKADSSLIPLQQLPLQLQQQSWRHKLFRALPWLQPQAEEQQPKALPPDVMIIQAEVPITLLRSVVEIAERQQCSPQLQLLAEQAQAMAQSEGAKQEGAAAQQQPPAMLLKLETDFLSKEQAVQVQLPVVWVLGDDISASQAIWQLLTSANQQPGVDAVQQDKYSQAESGSSKFGSNWQAARSRLTSAMTSLRQRGESAEQPQPQFVTVITAGICYALIRPTTIPHGALLSCVLLVLSCFASTQHATASVQQVEASLQNLLSRLRAAYHRQQLQQLQLQLQDFGPPSGVIVLHTGDIDKRLEHTLSLIAQQANQMNIMQMGISMGSLPASEGFCGISGDDWMTWPNGGSADRHDEHLYWVRNRLRGSLMAALQSYRMKSSKL